jgi:hypothetical protein
MAYTGIAMTHGLNIAPEGFSLFNKMLRTTTTATTKTSDLRR